MEKLIKSCFELNGYILLNIEKISDNFIKIEYENDEFGKMVSIFDLRELLR